MFVKKIKTLNTLNKTKKKRIINHSEEKKYH